MRPNVVCILPVVMVLSLIAPRTVAAQEREGFWIGAGGGWGTAGLSCDECDEGREGSGTGYLKLGWTVNPRLLVGAEFNAWAKSYPVEQGVTAAANLYNASGALTFYPSASSGFFVKGGAGVSTANFDFDVEGTNVSIDVGTGLGLLTGAGYDIRVGRRVSVTPAVNVWFGNLGDVRLAGEPFQSNWRHNVVDFTIGITVH